MSVLSILHRWCGLSTLPYCMGGFSFNQMMAAYDHPLTKFQFSKIYLPQKFNFNLYQNVVTGLITPKKSLVYSHDWCMMTLKGVITDCNIILGLIFEAVASPHSFRPRTKEKEKRWVAVTFSFRGEIGDWSHGVALGHYLSWGPLP